MKYDWKSTQSAPTLWLPAHLIKGIRMRPTEATLTTSTPHIEAPLLARLSDDECLDLLAREIETHDSTHLDDVARLIGRLAVPIEL